MTIHIFAGNIKEAVTRCESRGIDPYGRHVRIWHKVDTFEGVEFAADDKILITGTFWELPEAYVIATAIKETMLRSNLGREALIMEANPT